MMLLDLRIRDLAIIEALDLEFAPGFNVVSGETGAGKSIIVHALGLGLGTRATSDVVRLGADSARVEASFEGSSRTRALLDEQDIEAEPGEPVILRRVIRATGRSRSYVNDTSVSVSTLRAVGATLVDFASQHESAVLLDQSRHRPVLDGYGQLDDRVEELRGDVVDLRAARKELAALRESAQRREEELDLLRHQADELEEAAPVEGETEDLERELHVLNNVTRLREALSFAEHGLYSGAGAAVEQVGASLEQLRPFTDLDDELAGGVGQLEQALYELEDVARTVSGIASRLSHDPHRIEEIEERLDTLRVLQRKHRCDEAELVEKLDQLSARIDRLDRAATDSEELSARVDQLQERATERAAAIRDARLETGREMEGRIAAILEELAMGGARFVVSVEPDPAGLTETGTDRVTFLLSANRGEPTRPLARVASGGELSRVLLSIKEVLRDASPTRTLVLDEIDSGIGGNTADVLGHKLQTMAGTDQLIVITHLPQIAALAGCHYRVGKNEHEGRTSVWAERLDADGRVRELSRMVAGKRHSKRSRALVEEMMDA